MPSVSRGESTAGGFHKERGMSPGYSDDEMLMTRKEVAQLCRVDVRTVDRWLMGGKLTCYRTPGGRVLFRRHDVLLYIGRAANQQRAV